MHIKIPLTVLKDNPADSAYAIKRTHLVRMYEDGLNQLEDVAKGNIQQTSEESPERLVAQLRWVGSERFLYQLVSALGDRHQKFDHKEFETLYNQDALNGTERPPCWMSVGDVYSRHQSELIQVDDLDRLYTRWCSSVNPSVVSIRSGGTPDDPDSFELVCRNTCLENDLTKLHLNQPLLNEILTSYRLYTISNHEFFQRNRYLGVIPPISHDLDQPYVQRTITPEALQGFLNNRGAA